MKHRWLILFTIVLGALSAPAAGQESEEAKDGDERFAFDKQCPALFAASSARKLTAEEKEILNTCIALYDDLIRRGEYLAEHPKSDGVLGIENFLTVDPWVWG